MHMCMREIISSGFVFPLYKWWQYPVTKQFSQVNFIKLLFYK